MRYPINCGFRLLLATLFSLAVSVGAALPNTITVTTLDDEDLVDGDCSCREAFLAASTNLAKDACGGGTAGIDTILFAPAVVGTLFLTLGELAVTESVTVIGPGTATFAISGSDTSRIIKVTNTGVLAISGITLTNGNAGSSFSDLGGAILIEGDLDATDVVIADCKSGYGGGMATNGAATSADLRRVTFLRNQAQSPLGGGFYASRGVISITECLFEKNGANFGGGLHNFAAFIQIDSSTFFDNEGGQGGGINNNTLGNMVIRNSTICGNRATRLSIGNDGGGIINFDSLWIYNSTISGNVSDPGTGGGLSSGAWTRAWINQSTIHGNHASVGGGGLTQNPNGVAELYGTIIAGNTGPTNPDLSDALQPGKIVSLGYNIIGDVSGSVFAPLLTDQTGGGGPPVLDPLLAPLAANGGVTLTQMPKPGSPAIDMGDCTLTGMTMDQRGLPRPVDDPGVLDTGDGCDVGAVETAPVPTEVTVGTIPVPGFSMLRNVPNPFNPRTAIAFSLPEAGRVRLTVHDVAGREIVVLVNDLRGSGDFVETWRGRDSAGRELPSGVYFARLEAGVSRLTHKMLLIR